MILSSCAIKIIIESNNWLSKKMHSTQYCGMSAMQQRFSGAPDRDLGLGGVTMPGDLLVYRYLFSEEQTIILFLSFI